MKLRYILTTVLAGLTLLFGCTPMELIRTTDNVKAEPSYLEIAPDGGEVKSKVFAGGNWTITEIPEWLTVSPASGSATDENGVEVTFSADVTYKSRKAQVLVNVGEESYMISIKQGAAIAPRSFEAGDYWMIATNSDGKYKAAMPVASGYGYLAVSDPEEVDGKLLGKALNIFTFTAVDGGYTITDTYGNYYYLNADYDSFNVSKTAPTDGSHIWTVEAAENDTWKIMNSLKGKYIQLDASYGTYGCYSAAKGTTPLLVKVEIEIEPEPLGDATDIKDIVSDEPEVIIEGLVTATCTKGVIITDKTASVYAYGAPALAVGDMVKLLGKFSNYNKGYQLKDITQHELISSENEVVYPEAVEISVETVPSLINQSPFMLAKYASVKGLVEVDSYNNALIKVGDYKVKSNYFDGSFAEYKDKAIELKGYVISYKESAKELNMVVTSFEELTDWTPEEPGDEPGDDIPAGPSIADVLKSEAGATVDAKGTVMAIHQKGFILGDATGSVYVYTNAVPEVSVGNNVTLSGTFDNYFGTLQIKSATISANDNSTAAPTYPTVIDLTEQTAYDAFKTYSATDPVDFAYVKIKGVMSSGRYINVGTSEKQSMLDWSNGNYSDFNGKTVIVTAYVKGFHSNGYYQLIETSVVLDEAGEGGEEGGEEGDDAEVTGVVDALTFESTGLADTATQGYQDWTYTAASGAVYAGQSNGGYDDVAYIQLRSKNNNSGVIVTTSAGKVAKVTVTWNEKTSAGRTLQIYGSSSAYTVPADLYDEAKSGTKLGEVVYDSAAPVSEFEVTGDNPFVGFRSADGAMYIDKIEVTWTE